MWHNVPKGVRMRTSTAKKLNEYLQNWLGTQAGSEETIVHLVEGGLPTKVVNHLIERGLPRRKVSEVIILFRPGKHRKRGGQPLAREEPERAVRGARILAGAQAALGDEKSALEWLREPKRRFEDRSPLQML